MTPEHAANGGKETLMDKLAKQSEHTKSQDKIVKEGSLENTIDKINAETKVESENIHQAVLNGELDNLTEDDMQKMEKAAEIKRLAEADAIIKANSENVLAEQREMRERAEKIKAAQFEKTFALRTGSNLILPFKFKNQELQIEFKNGAKTFKGDLARAFSKEYDTNTHLRRLIVRLDSKIEESNELTNRYRETIARQTKFAQGAESAGSGKTLPPVARESHALKTIQQQLTSQKPKSGNGPDLIDDFADMPTH